MMGSDDVFIPKLKALIDENIADPSLSVDTICQKLGLSRAQLHRIVKEQFNLPVTLYIRKVRMEKANYLLAHTDLRISEVADRVGINNPQNFSKYFASEYAISPKEFRRLGEDPDKDEHSTPALPPLPIAPLLPATASTSPEKPSIFRSAPPIDRRWIFYILLLIGLIIGLILYFSRHLQPVTRLAKPIVTSLAVLPIINMGSADTKPICEALMDDIYTAVSFIKYLRVTARSSSDPYGTAQKSNRQISEDLHVANVLRSKMLKTGDQIQMKIDLINAREDRLIWTKTYRVAYREVFQLTGQIAQDIARKLGLKNNPTAHKKPGLARTKNVATYNDFLQSRQLVSIRNKGKIRESITKFDHTLAPL